MYFLETSKVKHLIEQMANVLGKKTKVLHIVTANLATPLFLFHDIIIFINW